MKFKGSYIFKALTALVLALLMVFGTVATSMAAVVDDLAESGYDAHFTLIGDDVGWSAKQSLNNVITAGSSWYGYAFLTNNKSFALHNGSSQYSNGEVFKIKGDGDNGRQSSYTTNGFKYKSASQVVKICYDESNNREWYPWVWLEAANIYLSGDSGLASASWDTSGKSADKMTLSSGKYTITKTNVNAGTYQYKVNAGDGWIYNPLSSNQSVTVPHNGDSVTIVFNPSSKTTTATVTHQSYTVTLNNNGGTINAGNVTSYKCGTGATLPTNVTKTGYTFDGWRDNSSLTGSAVTSISTTTTGNKEYWAKWTQNTYAITLSETGGSGTMKIDGTTRSSGYAVTHGSHTFSVTAPTGKVVKSISGIGTWSGVGTETASLGSTSITSAKTITVEYEDAGTCGFTLSKSSTSLNIGATDTITVTPNAYHSSGTISATSSNTSVATVSYNTSTNKFTVTAKSHGTATITISCTEGGTATFPVTVNTPTISIALGSSSLNIGGTTTITPTVTNQGTATVTYTSSNTSVATISGTTITAVAPGTTNITATVDGVTSTAKTLTVKTPTITVANNTTIKVGETYTPSATLTNPSSASGKWTVGYVLKSGTTATTNGTTITAVNYGSATTFTAQYKYDGTVVAYKDFTVTPVTPSITAFSYSKINVGGTANPSVTKSNVDNMTVSYAVQSGSAVTVNSETGQITGVVPTASNTTKVRVTYTYGSCSVYKDATVTVNSPTVTMAAKEGVKGETVTFSATTSNPSNLTIAYSLKSTVSGVSINATTGVVSIASSCTASSATVVASAKNSAGTVVATKEAALTIVNPDYKIKDGSTTLTNSSVIQMTTGATKQLTLEQNYSNYSYTFTSSDTSVVTVTDTGKLTAQSKKGTATITVHATNSPTRSASGIMRGFLDLVASGIAPGTDLTFTVNVTEAESGHVIYFTDNASWGSVYIHAWGADGTGAIVDRTTDAAAMTLVGVNNSNQNVYAYRFTDAQWAQVQHLRFLKAKNSGWDGSDSTATATSFTSNAWYSSANGNSNRTLGTWTCHLQKPQITASNVTIDMGSTQTMTATVLTSGTPSTFNWSSGTTSVATTADTHTDSNVITGVAPGNSTITIKAYAEKPSGWNSIVTDGTADDYVAGTTTATATVVAENKTVTFGEKKTDNGSTFTDGSGHITAKYYDEDTSSGSGSSGGSGTATNYKVLYGDQTDLGSTSNATVYLVDGSYVANLSSDTTFLNALNSHTSNFYIAMSSSSSPSDIISITNANSVTLSGNMASVYGKDAQQRDFSGTKLFARIWRSGSTNVAGFKFTQSGSSYAFEISSSAISDGGSGSGSSGGESGGESSGTGYTGEGTTMTSPQSVPYGKIAVFTAQATYISGSDTYAFAEWVDGSNNTLSTDLEYAVKITEAKSVYARYYKVFKLSAFDSYTSDGTNVTFVTAHPKLITIKHGDDTYIYNYDGTAETGNPDSPAGDTASDKADPLDIESGTYGQGNYIQYYAGDEITLYYSAMASSEIFKGVFYNNSENYFVKKPDASQFVSHDYSTGKTLYMNSAYYGNVPSGLPTTTVDHDAHSIKFTGTQDYKNIDVELATKRKVYFSDYTNAIIGSKNTDDYYYDGEALSVNGDQLTVAAAQSATQTNKIDNSSSSTTKPGFYRANADGSKGKALTSTEINALGLSITTGTSTSTSSANGTALVISGNMPAYDLYIDLNMQNSYSIKLGTLIVSDLGGSAKRLKDKATTISIAGSTTLNANTSGYVTGSATSVSTGSSATLTVSGLYPGYMFVGWYWGSDSAPYYDKGFISDKLMLSYTPKKGGTIWAVGTKDLFINGSKYITGKNTDWYSENNTWKNQKMSFDPSRGTQGSYYWEITDTMFASAGSNFKTWKTNWNNWDEKTTDYGIYKLSEGNYYWTDNNDSYHGKSYFQFLDNATGNDSKSVWSQIYSFEESQEGATYGKAYMRDEPNDESKRWNGQGFINFNETDYSGYSSPIRIYLDADTKALDVRPTPIYSNLYVSNGYNVGSTLKSDAVTVQPVVDGAVKTSGQTGYFVVKTEGNGWTQLNHEGTVKHYIPQKKGATVRITKEARGSDKIAAFLIYDIDNKTVRAERNLTKGTTANSKTPYYFDLTLANERQNLYIVPIVEEANSKVTITFDATQLNRAQWGDIVSAYSWYKSGNAPGLGDYPGQPMIPSDDMSTWTASFPVTKNGSELAGITFSNYVDSENGHGHSWLGEPGVLGTVNDHKTGAAEGGIINVYNHVDSGTNGEFSRTNYKAQTYDYHEPIALYNRYKGEQSVNITFQMKDGNSSLISWRHTEFDDNNILNLPPQWGKLNWEYLTNAKGDQYIDMNGKPMGENNKPTASFYVAAKGQVIYQDSKMNYVFHGGHDYQMKGYAGTYNNGTYSRSALSAWNSDITYYGANGLNMSYAVQWYVYDASGNYITTVLSAGIADLSSNNTDTYIAKQLEDLGYAVDGKSVAICYDKPRYMYSDSTVTNSANNINSGTDFNAYRFEGQWIAAAHTDTVKVNVEVAMMTDSGEVLAKSNTAGYGNATAALYFSDKNNYGLPGYATSANDGSWAQTAATDAKLNGIVLNASSQNFQGWYYYDANTGDFTKASYASNVGFRPNYSNKDVTYYAVYRASAIYQYKYTGREGERTYSASGEDLTAAEMGAHNVINPASHETDIKNKVPVGIGIFKKNIDFSPTNYNNWNKTADPNGYILDITGFNVDELPTYTLTAHYKNANGDLISISKTATYNTTPVDLTTEAYTTSDNSTKAAGTAPTTYYGQRFLGWYSYDGSTAGNLISTQANYGLRLTGNQSIIAVYDENSNALPNDGWNAEIDENEYNKELTTSDSGVYYNDTIVRIRYGSDVKATLPSGGRVGVIVIRDNKVTTASTAINGYNSTQLTQIANAVASGNTAKLKNGYSVTNLSTTNVTQFNRSDLAARSDYKNSLGSKYTVYAYVYDGSAYHFSAPSTVKTFE